MPGRHALIVGIDQYSNFEERYQLRGCVKDAELIKSVLIDHFQFEESGITELHNAAASQKGILDAMAQLADRIGQDDIVLFHFSGHGSQRKSTNPDEGTGMDSTICPADTGTVDPFPNLDITDDQIHEWLERLARKTRYTTLIFDCCHSGTITRDAFGAQVRAVPADRRSLAAMGIDPARLPASSSAGQRDTGSEEGRRSLSDSHVVMSGCRDDEYAYEHKHSYELGNEPIRNGALTYFLTGALLRARPGSTYRDVFELARQNVNIAYRDQHPQIEGMQDREIFGIRDIEPLRFIPIASVDGDRVTLRGGAALGLFVNSVWTAYPQGTKQTRDSSPLGKIEITRVGPLSSEGVIREGADKLDVGARCVESAPSAARFVLNVNLGDMDEVAATALKDRMTRSSLLTVVETPSAADMRVQILTPGEAESSMGIEQHPARVDAPCWAVVDRAGKLATPISVVEEKGAIDRMVSNLEAIARYRNALVLENPESALNVAFNIYRVGSDGELKDANGGDLVFDEGDRLAFEMINREQRNIFVSVLDFGLTGRISLIYPQNRAGEMIAAGQSVKIGVGQQRLTLAVPDDFHAHQGTETFKAFIGTDEADFRWLQQGGVRSVDSDVSRLRRHFEAAYHGPKTRDASLQLDDGAGEDWIALARSFELRRRPG